MPKGSSQATQQYNTANSNEGTFSNRGTSAYNAMMPELTSEATNPKGLSPSEMATANTANQQSVGGAVGGATSLGNLESGRTRNAGGFAGALDSASRAGSRQLSNDTLKTQQMSNELAESKQQDALKELGSVYGQNTSALNDMMKNANTATSNLTTADQDTTGDIMKGVQMAGSMGMGGAELSQGMNPGMGVA